MHAVLRFIVLIAFGLLFPASRAIAHENVITWATNPNYPPYGWSVSDSEYAGACIELLSMIAPKGYVFKAVVVPWARAQAMAEEGRIDMLINIRITPEREKWLEFSKNPTFHNPISVFMRKDKAIPFKSWGELKPLRGGKTLGDAFGGGFDEYARENLKIEAIANMKGNFLKLNSGRIDYFVSGHYMGLAWLSSAGLVNRITVLSPPVSDSSIHLGFSKKSPHLAVLPQIDQELSRLEKSGALKIMLEKHMKIFAETPLKGFAD